MSWQLFKQNILAVANRPDGIPDIDTIARLYADEYDAAIKRGGDLLHGIPLQSGNKLLMEQMFKLALQKGLSSTGPYDLVGEMGEGVKAYWVGAQMQRFGTRPGQPLPIVPPVPKVTIIETNIVTNNGVWIPPIPSVNNPTEEEIQKQETEALKEDQAQYKETEKQFDALFDSQQAAEAHNKPIPYAGDKNFTPAQTDDEVDAPYGTMDMGGGGKVKGIPYTEDSSGNRYTNMLRDSNEDNTKSTGASYRKLKDTYGEGNYPALDNGGVFSVRSTEANGRLWYNPNPAYQKLLTYVTFPVGNGQVKFLVHRKFAPIVTNVANLVKQRNLQQYVKSIGGGLAIRNSTVAPNDNTNLSFHAWGLACDVNSVEYPYGTRFSTDFKQIFVNGSWRQCNSNDIGFVKVAKCFIEAGCGWLGNFSNKDAMHFSIEEGGYKGSIPF